jgi:hypothetical protein
MIFANGLEFSKWSWPCTYPNLMSIFGVIHLEFYFKAWTLCLMSTITLFYKNPRFEFDFNANDRLNGQFEFSKWYEYIFAKLGILLQKSPCVY